MNSLLNVALRERKGLCIFGRRLTSLFTDCGEMTYTSDATAACETMPPHYLRHTDTSRRLSDEGARTLGR